MLLTEQEVYDAVVLRAPGADELSSPEKSGRSRPIRRRYSSGARSSARALSFLSTSSRNAFVMALSHV